MFSSGGSEHSDTSEGSAVRIPMNRNVEILHPSTPTKHKTEHFVVFGFVFYNRVRLEFLIKQ